MVIISTPTFMHKYERAQAMPNYSEKSKDSFTSAYWKVLAEFWPDILQIFPMCYKCIIFSTQIIKERLSDLNSLLRVAYFYYLQDDQKTAGNLRNSQTL